MEWKIVCIFILLICCLCTCSVLRKVRSNDFLIGSTNLGATATNGEQGVSDCIARGNPVWMCYTEQTGINPQW